MRTTSKLLAFGLALLCTAARAAPPSVFIDDLTWIEVRDALKAGTTTIIIPVGGTEQNGPHMALGKHNVRARALAAKVAATLGNALVAPVVSYTPEGNISPPSGHMRYPGTVSISDDAFKGLLEGAARSFKQHGFRHIVWLGDSGNHQTLIKAVATKLNREWVATSPATAARAHFIADYHRTGQTAYVQALRDKGLSDAQIGTHAGAADTSLLMAIDASLLRPERMAPGSNAADADGVAGDPRVASAALGQIGVDLIVARSVAAIQNAINAQGAERR
jgi:creatinine amidohydrolase/Fe(II)-dependent formamide hydrolase-like protein